jgi:hypothetical protein
LSPAMSSKVNSAVAVIGIDIGKNSFHVIGQDKRGAIMLRQKWSRGQVEALANLPRGVAVRQGLRFLRRGARPRQRQKLQQTIVDHERTLGPILLSRFTRSITMPTLFLAPKKFSRHVIFELQELARA